MEYFKNLKIQGSLQDIYSAIPKEDDNSEVWEEYSEQNCMDNSEDIYTEEFDETTLKEPEINNEKQDTSEGLDTEKKESKINSFKIFKLLFQRYDFKCCNGQMFVYWDKEGRYIHLNDLDLKVLIRDGWDEKIQEKLSRNVVLEIIERLITEPTIQVEDSYFNSNIHLMNFWNGVLDLEADEFIEHSPEFGFTHCIQANYDPEPEGGDTFKKFILKSMERNGEKINHLQEILGYILSEYYSAKKAPMLIGQPHSGKSTLNRVISELIGKDHVANVPLHRLHERFILAHLSTKKVNICSEISDEAITNIDVFKSITGNDELVAEYKGKDHFTYKSKIKLLFSGNSMPILKNRDITTAFYDRLTFVNFNYTVPEEERDLNLESKLLGEDRTFIVAWAVAGIKILKENNFVFSESEESIQYKKKYIEDQNNTVDFIKSNCVLGNGLRVHLRELYDEYINYCNSNCFTPYSRDIFFTEVSKYDTSKKKFRLNGSNALWGYEGITLKIKM